MHGGARRSNPALRWSLIAFVFASAVSALVWLSWPEPHTYVTGEASRAAEDACAYEEASRAAANAANAYERARQTGAGARRRQIEADAAQRRAQGAKECEERARNRADLDAQWRSAYATENTYAITNKLRWLAIAEIALLVAAVLAAWMAIFDSRQHAERELRAYMGVDTAQLVKIDVDGVVTAQLRFKNYGQTPAYDFTYWGTLGWRPVEDAGSESGITTIKFPEGSFEKHPDALEDESRMTFNPSAGATNNFKTKGPPPIAGVVEGYRQHGTFAIVLYGKGRYLDAFGEEREIEFGYYSTNKVEWPKLRLLPILNKSN